MVMVTNIKMSPGDVAYATTEAIARFNFNRAIGNQNYRGSAPTCVEQLAREVSGCLGELAIGRWMDIYPFSVFEERKMGDVGEFEVRTTAYVTGKLILTKDDNPERKYLLVTLPTYDSANIVGWMWGYEAQVEQHWDEKMRMPAYMVKQEFLHDPASLL